MPGTPIIYTWNGEAMEPLPRFHNLVNAEFVVGERYRLSEDNERSRATHNHFFAAVQDAWETLPEHMAERFATSKHLRKWALIKCGYRDERSIVCASKAEAQRLAAFIKPMDEFAVVVVTEAMVTVCTAKSQSRKAMGGKDFQDSKQAVLDYLDGLIGTERGALAKNAGQAA